MPGEHAGPNPPPTATPPLLTPTLHSAELCQERSAGMGVIGGGSGEGKRRKEAEKEKGVNTIVSHQAKGQFILLH